MDNTTQTFPQYHTHNNADGTPKLDEENSIINTRKSIIIVLIPAANPNTATTTIGGDFVMPFDGYFTDVGATVDTAGTTGTMTIDINKNGTTILPTKISIATGVKTSRSNTTQPVLNPNTRNFIIGDIITFDVDAIQTTPAKGLKMFLNCIKTS